MRSLPLAIVAAVVLTACGAVEGAPTPPGAGASAAIGRADAPAPAVPAGGAAQARATTPEPERFQGTVAWIDTELRDRLVGRNWHPGCPVPIRDLRLVEVSYWNFRGQVRTGPLVLHEKVAQDVVWVFRQIFRAEFPIHRIALPPRYRPPRPDDEENARNLSSSFNCRPVIGYPDTLSEHSYGWAVDINPMKNPYVGSDLSAIRDAAKPFLDRSRRAPGMIHDGDVVVRSFARIGWEWGGDWTTIKDYMHFSLTGR